MLNKYYVTITMVKNSKGGKNSKRMARKHVNTVSQRALRCVKEEGEMYAIVSKNFGGQCEVVTTDGQTRLCIVRGKFKGRQRRDNNISQGSWIMVGIRDWEMRGDGKTKCDLLYVYSDLDREELKQSTGLSFKALDRINTEMTGVTIDDGVVFKDDNTTEYKNDDVDAADNADNADNVVLSSAKYHYEFDVDEI